MSTEAAVDPIDALDLSDTNEVEADVSLPPEMVMGDPPADEPEAAEPSNEPEATPEAERPALPEGYKYDSVGRVRDAKTGHVVAKDKVAEILAAAQTPAGKPQPFKYRTNGETKDVEGFLENADGSVTVTKEKAGELRYLLNARDMLGANSEYVNTIKAENAALKQEVAQSKQGSTVEAQKAKALVDAYTKVLADPNEENALIEFFKLRQDYPVLLAKAEAEYYKTRGQPGKPAPREVAAPEVQSPGLPAREDALATVTEFLEQRKLEVAFRDVGADDWKQFSERAARTPYAYFRPATAQEATQYGYREGEIVFDTDAIHADLEQYTANQRSAREAAARQANLAVANARKTQPSIDAPPVPGSSAPPAKGRREFKNEQDIDNWLDSDEL